MLYIGRKEGESLIINDNIKVTVVEVRGKSARLSITCPDGTQILREELFEKIQAENQAAAESARILRIGDS